MFTGALPFTPHILPSAFRRKLEAAAAVSSSMAEEGGRRVGKRANLSAHRKDRIKLPEYADSRARDFPIRDFLAHPSGIETLLNTRALQSFEPLDTNTFRCTLPKIQILQFDAVPVLDLRVTPTREECKVEMLSCKFEGSQAVVQQNHLFSAFMLNHITWEENCLEPCLEVDVYLKITLEVYTKPFSLLPVSVVEKPGNLVMQGLIDRLVPLLTEQLLADYCAWIEQQVQLSSQNPHSP